MFYKPNYCCNCGEKIERVTPSITDSRRFCDVCKHDFVLHRSLTPVFAALMAIFGVFGVGSYWRNSVDKPSVPATRQIAANPSNTGKNPINNASVSGSNLNAKPAPSAVNVQTNAALPILTNKPPAMRNAAPPAPPDEAVYFCGAPTKKGTPCSRRVRGGGRCWQHKGLDAMLPPEKLTVSR